MYLGVKLTKRKQKEGKIVDICQKYAQKSYFSVLMFACTAYCVYLCSVFQEDIHKEISKDNVELKKRKVKRL